MESVSARRSEDAESEMKSFSSSAGSEGFVGRVSSMLEGDCRLASPSVDCGLASPSVDCRFASPSVDCGLASPSVDCRFASPSVDCGFASHLATSIGRPREQKEQILTILVDADLVGIVDRSKGNGCVWSLLLR
mgnify:CR=1 FL=1